MVMKRFLDQDNLERIKNDFEFLISMFQGKDYIGEFDLALRDNYFNIYYQGNSLARVEFYKDDMYGVKINQKFFDETSAKNDKRFKAIEKGDYYEIELDKNLLHPFFQKKYINEFASNIRKTNYSEDLARELAIITDNLNREDIIFIDRQVMSGDFPGRLDLLALQQVEKNKYSFLVIEVKLGKNPELGKQVAQQLKGYISHIDKNFNDYKKCYEEQYKQKKQIGLIRTPNFKTIDIIRPVKGLILSVGYSGIARGKINQLRRNHPELDIRTMNYHINIDKKIPEEVKQAMNDLNYNFMTVNDYYQAIEDGELVKKPGFVDDMRFYSENPGHPLAGDNRFKRIKAADQIREYCKKGREELPQEVLNALHVSLFDCCASVRHSVAQTLFYGGNDTSIPLLQNLIDTEKESKVVKKAAEISLLKLKFPYPLPTDKNKIIIFISNNIDLALKLNDLCQAHGIKIIFPETDSSDIFAISSLALIVDRDYIDKDVWESYCEYCEETKENIPVFVIDNNLERAIEEYPILPKHDNVFLIEQWLPDTIEQELTKLILNIKN